jgi:hypothetical protein
MAPITVIVNLDPEGQIALELTGRDPFLSIVIEDQLQLQSGEEALYHGVVPAASFGGHAADDLLLSKQIAVVGAAGGRRLEDIENQRKNDNLAGRLASSTAGAPVLTAVQALNSGLLKVDDPVAPV